MGMQLKQCIRCGEEFDRTEFNKDKGNKDGLACYCRECQKRSRRTKEEVAISKRQRKLELDERKELLNKGLRRCAKCKNIQPCSEFDRSKVYADGYQYQCKSCSRLAAKERTRRIKQQAINHYGGRCDCCGEKLLEFLVMHHVNGDGKKHREEDGLRRNGIYEWLIKNNYPEGFQVYCHNCHSALHFYGYCPHTKKTISA